MKEAQLIVLGVYRPFISQEVWQEQWAVTGNDKNTKEHFENLVLIEAVIEGLHEPFNMSKFGQMSAEFPDDPNYMQVGYDEGLLSADGESLIERNMNCVRGTGALRFAVYLHYYDAKRPLQWQAGHVKCPPVKEIPARLILLMPYNACT